MMKPSATQLSFSMFLLLGAISALTPLAIDMYLPAMPAIADDFGVSPGDVQVTLTIYTLGFAIGQLFYGPLADSIGRRPVLLGGVALFLLGAIGCTFTHSVEMLVWVRLLQGFAGAAAAVVIQAVVRDMFEAEDFARTMSFITLVMTVAPLLAPMIGGHVSVYAGWRAVFAILAVFSVIMLVAIYYKIPETLAKENRQPFHLGTSLRNYARLLRNRQAMGLIMCGAFSFSGMFVFLTAGSFVYIDLYGVPVQDFGYLFGLNVLTLVAFTILNGRVVKKYGSRNMIMFGLSIQLIAGIGLFICWLANLGLIFIVPCVMLYIGTVSTIGSNGMALLLNNYPNMAGTTSSIAGTIRFGLGSLMGFFVATLPGDQSWPMLTMMGLCAVLSITIYKVFGESK
ncbi:Bcr/CflA family drug resistance efflux transporter [Vibrio sp. UCD-FRSSP16_10]|uniref:Bcr/CflA family multidrug efflux MFS transporter n=1 Tax=unclassified Vibrio TaxID=2614977 RepID=UPI0008019C19|nr:MULTISPECIES: Bcr/CflA family multidrug efflux MFS transporter [unclassified Vibrio]OBT13473.1 Bcr/CflA family drug resistance efflux transporter [Vibrio sp. UCD-FRSSP16_10]OBT17982.1 Bcr/CflA family drug resistance efflux transporter [Vibrio sp. UCD-FRSSP16_30]